MVPSPDLMQLVGSIMGAQDSRKKAPSDSLQNSSGAARQDNILKCFLICFECL